MEFTMINRTIAAVSTPFGKGGIAVIRISGESTAEILGKIFVPKGQTVPSDAPRQAVFGDIVSSDGKIIDTGVAVFYKAPASFTGEDTAELSCHGGILVTRCVLEAVFAAGASPAEAGEFTRRSFLNGKMTLSEAEAVGLLLDADTQSRMELASSGARGILSEKLSAIGDRVSAVLSNLFALIDYPDEDIDEVGAERLSHELLTAASEAEALCATFRTGRAIAEGIPTLICGRPNAGKSSLYNALAGEDRAIVTAIPGTTRDVLEDTVDCGGVTLRLWDTAGIRDEGDEVELMGIERARSRMSEAELILAVYDGSAELATEDISLMDELSARTAGRDTCKIAVINKSDKGIALSEDQYELVRNRHDVTVEISAKAGEGIDSLREKIGELYGLGEIKLGEDAVVWDASRKAELEVAAALLREAAAQLAAGEPEDAVCSTAELALAAVRRTDGRGVSEEIVNGIFARFCVGK